jgi:hypothetical protein
MEPAWLPHHRLLTLAMKARYRSLMNDVAAPASPPTIHPTVRSWLRLEGLAAFLAGLAIYGANGGPWLLVIPFLLVPDVSMLGYLRDPRLGAFTYNRSTTGPSVWRCWASACGPGWTGSCWSGPSSWPTSVWIASPGTG